MIHIPVEFLTFADSGRHRTSELREIGLISLWEKQFEPNTNPCFSQNENVRDGKDKPLQRLSLTNLMGAFALLAFGYLVSIVVFLTERVFSILKTNNVIVA
jgi:glutamate receptor, ionotropic, invertebrate